MKAGERKRKREEERLKKLSESSNTNTNEIQKKKLISIPSKQNDELLKQRKLEDLNINIIQNIPASRPANNVDVEKISQKIKERKERKKRKNQMNNSIDPVFIDNNKSFINIFSNYRHSLIF